MEHSSTKQVDACCLACSLPLVKLAARVRKGHPGEVFEAVSDVPGFLDDVKLWCRTTGHILLGHTQKDRTSTVIVKKRELK